MDDVFFKRKIAHKLKKKMNKRYRGMPWTKCKHVIKQADKLFITATKKKNKKRINVLEKYKPCSLSQCNIFVTGTNVVEQLLIEGLWNRRALDTVQYIQCVLKIAARFQGSFSII